MLFSRIQTYWQYTLIEQGHSHNSVVYKSMQKLLAHKCQVYNLSQVKQEDRP